MRTPVPFLLVIFAALVTIPLLGQNFTHHSASPFGIKLIHEDSTRGASQVMFFDFDGDSDLDLFLTGIDYVDDTENWESLHYFIEMQENIGDKWNPQFADRVEPFANFPFPLGYFFPAIGDVNNDGNPDFVVFGEVNFFGGRTMLYLESEGGPGAGFNVVQGDLFDLVDFVPESFFIPELVDLDADGDLDVLMSGADPAFAEEDGPDVPTYYYARNGDSSTPSAVADFEGWYWNPYGLTPNLLPEILTSGDIDNDGDVDLLGTSTVIPQDSMNQLYVHLNAPGVNGKPAFGTTLQSPFGLPTSFGEAQFFFPELVDIDGDGDLDLFVFQLGVDGTTLQHYENTLCEVSFNTQAETICDNESIVIGGVEYTEAGEYTVVSEGANGCTIVTTLTLSESPTFSVHLEETICDGHVYSIGSDDFSVSGVYEVHLSTSAGCDSLITLDLNVFDIDNSVNVAGEILTANHSGASYQWIDCDTGEDIPGATDQSYEVLATGNYAVIVTDGGDCSESSDCFFVVVTGIRDQQFANHVSIYPNPADDVLSIRNETSLLVTSVAVINVSGQHVGEYLFQEGVALDISSLESGVYFVKLHLNAEIVIRKLVVI